MIPVMNEIYENIIIRDAELAVAHDYPDDKYGHGYQMFVDSEDIDVLDRYYEVAWFAASFHEGVK